MTSEGWPGAADRETAAALVGSLPAPARSALRWAGLDLATSAEHLIYTALRQASPPSGGGLMRALARIGRAVAASRGSPAPGRGRTIAVVVSQPVHVALYEPIAARLRERGLASVIIDGDTRRAPASRLASVDAHLSEYLGIADAAALARHAIEVHARLSRPPRTWGERLGEGGAEALLRVLRRGLPLVALDMARADAMLRTVRPDVVACFSESGMLARTVPTAARRRGIRSIDLPHAEAADPWGSAGAGYDTMAVYGPRSRAALEAAGIASDRIVEIGPLRYDGLLAEQPRPPARDPRRVVFASQPGDPRRPALHPDVKRGAMAAALAATEVLAPAELIVAPHPTEPAGEAERLLTEVASADSPPARVDREDGLHSLLRGAWLLVTASSQSVFDATVSGVPAITFNPPGVADPVSFAAEGIAIGVTSAAEAAVAAAELADLERRTSAAARARVALGDRIGPLDGRTSERAADLLAGVALTMRG